MSVANPLEHLLGVAPPRKTREPVTARVVRSDSSGVWCVPLDSDTRHPIGPCRGARRLVVDGQVQQLPAGAVVLLVFTAERPWVAAWEEEG